MKNLLYLNLLFISISLLVACSKSNNKQPDQHPPGVPTSPETKPQYDNTSFGVYKGVIIGSSGIIIIKVNNGDNIIKAYLTIDNQRDTLSTLQTLTPGQAINNLSLTGRFSSLRLSANADGSNAQISNLVITGHPLVTALIVHENSNRQVLLYEGVFSGEISGRINFVKVGAEARTEPVEYIAKVSTDNYIMKGSAVAELDSGSRDHTHHIFDNGGYSRGFTGYMKFTLANVTGPYNSYVHSELRSYRGTVECKRTY